MDRCRLAAPEWVGRGGDPAVADGATDHGAERAIRLAVPADVHVAPASLAIDPAGMAGVEEGEHRAVQQAADGDLRPAAVGGDGGFELPDRLRRQNKGGQAAARALGFNSRGENRRPLG